jgi:hypothetical protein
MDFDDDERALERNEDQVREPAIKDTGVLRARP